MKLKSSLGIFSVLLFLWSINTSVVFGQTYYNMSSGNYSETFTSWTSPATNSWSVVSSNPSTIPNANAITVSSTNFSTGTSGGIQNGGTNIQFLSTGTSNNTSSVALDLNLNFSGKNAESLSFDASTVFNSTGNRAGTLRVYFSTDNSNWTELTATNLPFEANNNVAKSASISLPLPSGINNQATVKLRFYYHNGGTNLPSPTGARPKIAIDNVVVSAVNTGPNVNLSKTNIANLNYFENQGPSPTESYGLTGSQLTSDVTISAPTNFEISTVGMNSGFMDNIILSPNAGALNTIIYTRLKSGLPIGNYQGNITHTGGGISSIPALGLTGEVTPIILPTKLIITNISPASPNINTPFSISLQAVDQNNIPRTVSTNTTVNLSLVNGTGVLSGTLSGEMSVGTNAMTINGLIYNKEETGIIIAASSVLGDPLSTGQSLPFEVIQTVFPNEIKSIRNGNWNDPNTWSCNCVPTFTDNVRVRSPHRITVVPLPTEQGCALILIEPGAVFDLQTGVFRMNMAPPPPQITNINLTLGNPSNATTTISTPDNYLLDKPQYVMSYNRSKATSNWVSWYLNSSSIGSTSRQNDFRPDPQLPAGWYQVTDTDYSGSGFDRGHMTPSGDRTSSVANNSATFLMTNMIPQAPGNNQGPWEKLESYLRGQLNANGGQEIYIIAGSYGQGGTGTSGFANTIAGGKISVPSYTYKIALILPNGEDDLNRISNTTRVIAVIMPNIESIRPNQWQPYRTTVDAIEAATGYDFLSNIPITIQDVLEAQTDVVAN